MRMDTQQNKVSAMTWVGLVVVYMLIPGVLLASAGQWNWWQAWLYGALVVAAGINGRVWTEARHSGIMTEWTDLKEFTDVKPWDKILSPLMSLSVGFPLVIVAGLDHRYAWTKALPFWAELLGFVLIAGGYSFAVWAMVENAYFSSVVRIQSERGHKVCESGPYRYVRHPGYFGNILPLIGIVLALDTFWTLIPAGAAGYLTKTAASTELVHAIRTVIKGQVYLQPSLARWLLEDYQRISGLRVGEKIVNLPSVGIEALTTRELEVLEMVANGLNSPEIGRKLGLSPKTIARHRERITAKLNLHSRTELVKFAIRTGLVQVE